MQKGYYAASFCRILMARDFFTMDDFDLAGHTVLLRVDINSPVDPATGQLLNDARIREHLTTIRDLRHSKVVVMAHQSRPGKDDFTTLEAHAEYFILDAFAAAHRAQPSLVGFCDVLPSLAGRVMERELTMLTQAVQDPERPKVAHLGGVKADDSIAVARHMLEKNVVDTVLTSGGVANIFLDASGVDPGDPTTEFMR